MTTNLGFLELETSIKAALAEYPSLGKIVETSDLIYWQQFLSDKGDIDNYFETSKLNLLTTLTFAGNTIMQKIDTSFQQYQNIISAANHLIEQFPSLVSNKSFKQKIKNLEGFNFLATLSELSLAGKLQQDGCTIQFDAPFLNVETSKKKDFDIHALSKNGSNMYIEVYMPNLQSTIDGFFDPHENDAHFERKIQNKVTDKFGLAGIVDTNKKSEINGLKLLAVNQAFVESEYIKHNSMPFIKNDALYSDLLKTLPKDVDGYILFEDAFQSKNSFEQIGVFLNK